MGGRLTQGGASLALGSGIQPLRGWLPCAKAHVSSHLCSFRNVRFAPGVAGRVAQTCRKQHHALAFASENCARPPSPLSVKLLYRIALGRDSTSRRRLKLQINTREHESVFGLISRPLAVDSRWFSGSSEVTIYELDELLATKLRALYQRKKGRELPEWRKRRVT
ncbi:MAG: nucleotidyl transferase AbiEii/AbiGii toxin family protein [bacterium]|nr:nucleotidyl transferase AbiEii/AbiGii toxin family protein [bacterium]